MPFRKVLTDFEKYTLLTISSDASQMSKYHLLSEIGVIIILWNTV